MAQQINTPSSKLAPGMIVQFYGAKFRLRDDRKCHERGCDSGTSRVADELPVYTITGDWVEGAIISGYFGPNQPWHFQGNDLASWAVIHEEVAQ